MRNRRNKKARRGAAQLKHRRHVNGRARRAQRAATFVQTLNPMATVGKLVFGISGLGIGTGFSLAGLWSVDQLRSTDTRANQMISPSMPPSPPQGPPPPVAPPSPMLPPSPSPPPPLSPAGRRLLEEGTVFKFTEKEENKIVNDLRGSSIMSLSNKVKL